MRHKLWLILITMLLGPVLFPAFAEDTRYRVAVLPFDDGSIEHWWGKNWDVGKGVADELITELLKIGRFRLIEREKIDKILSEQDFGQQGRVDQRTAAKIGKILGAQYLIMGKVTEFSTNSTGGAVSVRNYALGIKTHTARVELDARLVDTTTSEIITAANGVGERKQSNLAMAIKWNIIAFGSNEFKQTNLGLALRDAVISVAQQLSEQAYRTGQAPVSTRVIEGLVADVYGDKVYITVGSGDGVKPGMIFEVQHIVRTVTHPTTGEVIDYITEPVATVKVTEVKEQSATCTIVSRLTTKYNIAPKDRVVLKN
ncbi:MAG TPA: CsgG/HfaB family protein [Bacillota bacterium]|nr:CsgG/HfaB family protein [Bacillota bacterium]